MADASATGASPHPEDETPNQKKARLRREKLQAKMASSGEERLAKIKQLNGGVAPPAEALGGPVPTLPKTSVAGDPDEVDISDGAFTPNKSGTGTPGGRGAGAGSGSDPLRDAMMQMQMQQASTGNAQGQQPTQQDPMAAMMQQMLGGMKGQGQDGQAPSMEEIQKDPMFRMMQTVMGGMGAQGNAAGEQAQQPAPTDSKAYIWRVAHAIFALLLASWIAVTSTFNGSKLSRSQSVYQSEADTYGFGRNFFLIFATAELVLQSSRYFVERGELQGSGLLATVANSGFVPEPYAGYVRVVGRYSTIYTTIVADAMVVIFFLGSFAWWKGAAVA